MRKRDMDAAGRDLGLLGLRLTVGGYLAAHGAQKLFGAFGGHGVQGTGGFFESLGMQPGEMHAIAAGAAELGSGVLTAAGLASPLGPAAALGPMVVASGTVHWGKGPFGQEGGPELPVTNIAACAALALAGPGALSLDRVLRLRLPAWVGGLAVAGALGGAAVTIARTLRARAAAEEVRASQARADEEGVDVSGQPAEWQADRTLAEQAAQGAPA